MSRFFQHLQIFWSRNDPTDLVLDSPKVDYVQESWRQHVTQVLA